MNPLVSRLIHAGVEVRADAVRTRAFWDAIRKVLGDPAPDAETRRLQSDIRAWLNAPLGARRNRVRQDNSHPRVLHQPQQKHPATNIL